MADIEIEDRTGSLPSSNDVNEAIAVISKFVTIGMMKLPPELAVQMPNILRCLKVAKTLIEYKER